MKFAGKSYIFFVLSVVASLSILLFLFIWLNLESLRSQNFEHDVSNFIQSFRNDALTSYMKFVTHVGDLFGYIVIILILGIILLLKRRFDLVIQIVSVVVSSALLNLVLKSLIDRPRPYGVALVKVNFHSFPSGHATSAIVFYGLMIYFIFKLTKNLSLKLLSSFFCILIILLIGVSRIYLGVHYPTDVLAGYSFGFFYLLVTLIIIEYFEFRNTRKT